MAVHGHIVVIKSSGEDGSIFPLITKTCRFGKDPDCDIRIQKDGVASQHCIVEVQIDSKVFLKRLSENSTLLNGKPLSMDWIGLKHKDIIQVSDRSFRWEYLPGSIHIDQDAEICRRHLINSNKENTPINKSSVITTGWKNSEKKVIDESSISHFIEDIGELKPSVSLVEHSITDKSEISRRRSKRFAVESVEGHTSVLHVSLGIGDAVENVEQQSSTVELNVKPQISKHDYIKPIRSGKKSVNRKSFSDTAMRASSEQKNLDKTHSSIYGEDIRESREIPKVIAADLEEQKSIRKGHKVKEFFVESFGSNNSLLDIGDSENLEEENFNCDVNEEELLSPKYKMELREITKSSKNTPKVKKKILETPAKLNSSVKDFDELHSSYLSENLVESMQSPNVISVGHSLVRKQIKSEIDVEPSETVTCPFNEISSIASQLGGSEQSSSTSEDCEVHYKLKVMVDSKTQPLLNLDEKSPQTRKSILITPGRTRSTKKLYNDVYISNFAEDTEPELKVKHGELIKSQKSVKFQRRSRFSVRAIEGITPLRNTGTNDSKLIDLDQSSLCNSKLEEEKTPKNGSILSPKDKKSEKKTLNESTSIFVEDTSKLKKTPATQELKSEAKKSVKRQRTCRRFTIDSIGTSTSPAKVDKGNTTEYDEMVKFGEDDQGDTHQISSNRTPRIRKSQLSTSVILKSTMKDFNESHSSGNTELLQTPNRTKISSLETLEITPINTRIKFKKSVQEENENTTLQTYITEQEQDLSVNSIDQYIPELLASSKKSIRDKWSISNTSVGIKPVKSKLNTSCVSSVKSTSGLLQTPNLTKEKPSTKKSGQSRRSGRKSALCKTTSDYHQIFNEKVNDGMLDVKGNSISEDTLEQHISIQSSKQGIHTLLTSGKKTNVCKKLISSTPKLKSLRKKLNESSSLNPLLDIAELLQTPNDTGDESLMNNSVQSLRKQKKTVMGTLGPRISNLFEEMDMQDILEVDENSITFDTLVQEKSVQSSHKDNPELFTAKEKTPKRKLTLSKTPKLSTSERNTVDNTPIQNPVEDIIKLLQKSNVTNENSTPFMNRGSLRSLKGDWKSTISTTPVQGQTINKSVIDRSDNTIPDDKFKQEQSEQISIEDYPEINISCNETPLSERSMSKTHLLLQTEKGMLDESCTSNAVEDIVGLLQTPNETRNDSLRDNSMQSLRKGRKSIKATPGFNISKPMEDEERNIVDQDNSLPLHSLGKDISIQAADQENPDLFRPVKKTPKDEFPALQTLKLSVSQNNTLEDSCISNHMEGIRELFQTPEVNKDESMKKHSVRSLRRGRNSITSTPVADNPLLSEVKIYENFLDESENAIQEDEFKQEKSEQISIEDYPEINISCNETPLSERSMSKTHLLLQTEKGMLDESCTSNAVEDIVGLLQTPNETRNDSLRDNSMQSLRKGRKSIKATPGFNISKPMEDEERNIVDQDNSLPLHSLGKDISIQAADQENPDLFRPVKKTPKDEFPALQTLKLSVSQNNTLEDSCISNHMEGIRELFQTPEVNKDESMKKHSVRSLRRGRNSITSTPVADNPLLSEVKIYENFLDESENAIQEDEFKQEKSEQISIEDYPEINISCKETPLSERSMSKTQLFLQSEKRMLDESCTSNAVEDIVGLLQTPNETRNDSLRDNSMQSLRKGRKSIKATPGFNISKPMEDEERNIVDQDNSLPLHSLGKDISIQAADQENPDLFRPVKKTPKDEFPALQTLKLSVSQNNTLEDSCISNHMEGIRELFQTPEVNKDESMKKHSFRSLGRGRNSIMSTPVADNPLLSEDPIYENILDESGNAIQEDEFKQEQSEKISLEDYPEINISCKETPLSERSMSKTQLFLQSEKRMLDESCTSNAVEDIAGLLQTPNETRNDSLRDNSMQSLRKGRKSIKATPGFNISNPMVDEVRNIVDQDSLPLHSLGKDISVQAADQENPDLFRPVKKTPKNKFPALQTLKLSVSQNNTLEDSCISNHMEGIRELLQTPEVNKDESMKKHSVRSLRRGRNSIMSTPVADNPLLSEDPIYENILDESGNAIQEDEFKQEQSEKISLEDYPEINISCKETPLSERSMSKTQLFLQSEKRMLDESCTSNAVEDIAGLLQTPNETRNDSLRDNSMQSLRKGRKSIKATPGFNISNPMVDEVRNIVDQDSLPLHSLGKDISVQAADQENPDLFRPVKKTPKNKFPALQTLKLSVSQNNTLEDSCISNHMEGIRELLQTPEVNKDESMKKHSVRSLRRGRNSIMSTPVADNPLLSEDPIYENILDESGNAIQEDEFKQEQSEKISLEDYPEINISCKETPLSERSMSKTQLFLQSEKRMLDESCTSNAVEDIAGLLQTPNETRNDSLRDNSMQSLRKGRKSIKATPGFNISNPMVDEVRNIVDQDSLPLHSLGKDISVQAADQENPDLFRPVKKTPKNKFPALQTLKLSVSQNNTLEDSCISNHMEGIRELLQTPEVNKDESMKKHSVRSLRRGRNSIMSTPVADNPLLSEDPIYENILDESGNAIQEDEFKQEQSEKISLEDYPEINISCKEAPLSERSMSKTQLLLQTEKRMLDESCTSNAVEDIVGLLQTPNETRNDSLRDNSMQSLRKGRKSIKATPGFNISNPMVDEVRNIVDQDSLPLHSLGKDISVQAADQENPDLFRPVKKTPKNKFPALQTLKLSVSQNNTLEDSCISNHMEGIRELLQTPEVNKDESMKKHSVRSLRRGRNSIMSTPVADNPLLSEDPIYENILDESGNAIQEDEFKQEQSEKISLEDYPEINISCKETPLSERSMSKTQLFLQSEKRMLDESCTSNAVEDIAGLLQTPNETRNDSLRDNSMQSLRKGKMSRIGSPATVDSQLMEDMINVNVKNVEENPNSTYIFEENLFAHSSKQDTNELLSSTEKATNRKMTSNTPLMVKSDRKSLDSSVSRPALDKADSFQTPNVSDNESLANKSFQSLRKKSKSVMGTPGFHSYNLSEDNANEIILESDKQSFPGDTLEKDISVNFSDRGHSELFNPAKKLPLGMLPKSKTPKELKLVKITLDDSSISNHEEDNAELFQVDIFNASSTNVSGLDDVIDVNSTTDEIKLNVDKCCNADLQIGDKSDVIGENPSISISVSKNDPSTLHGRALFPVVLLSRLPSGFLGSHPTILSSSTDSTEGDRTPRTTRDKKIADVKESETKLVAISDIANKSRGRKIQIIEETDVNNDFVATSNSADVCSEGERTSRTTRNKNLSFGNEATSVTKSSTESSTKGEMTTRPTRTTRIKNLSTVKESETALVAKSDLTTKSSGRRKRTIDETDVNNDSEVGFSSADNSSEGERKTRTTRNKKSALKDSEATLAIKSSTENSAEGDRSTRTTRNTKLAAVTESDTKLVATSSTDNSTEGDRTTRTTRNKTLSAIKESETTLNAKSDLATKSSERRKQTIDETDVNNDSEVICSSSDNSAEGERKTRTTRNKKSALKESEATLVTKSSTDNSTEGDRTSRTNRNKKLPAIKESETTLAAKSDLATKSSGRRKRTIDETDVNNDSEVICSSADNSTERERKTRITRNKKSALKESEATLVTKSSTDNSTEGDRTSRTNRNKKLSVIKESETTLAAISDLATKSSGRRKRTIDKTDVNNDSEVVCSSADNSTEGERKTRTTRNKKSGLMESEATLVTKSSIDNNTEVEGISRTTRNKKLIAVEESETALLGKRFTNRSTDKSTEGDRTTRTTKNKKNASIMESNTKLVATSSTDNSTEGDRTTRTTRNKKLPAIKESETTLVAKSDLATTSSGRRKQTIDETDVNNDSEVICCSADNSTEGERKTKTTRNKKSALKESEAQLVTKSSTDNATEGDRTTRTTRNKKLPAIKESETTLVAQSDLATKSSGRRKRTIDETDVNNDSEVVCSSADNSTERERKTRITRNKKSALEESEATLVTKSNTEVERMTRTTRNKKLSAEKASETALVAKSENTEGDSLGPPAKRSKNSVEDKRIVNDNIEKLESSSNAGKNGRRNTIKSYKLDLESQLNAEGKENSSSATRHQNIKKSDARKNSKKSVTSKRNTAQRNINDVDDTADSSADNASYKSLIKSKVVQKKVNESIKVPGMTKTDECKAIQSRGKRKVHFETANNEIEKYPIISNKRISLRSKTK